ncbi:hypothetical protein JYU20_00550 [Bacteroidales bacterium AH-315-I05]|nr:hypothetical protein [Bacteroidales bacterium AH-315-I05]
MSKQFLYIIGGLMLIIVIMYALRTWQRTQAAKQQAQAEQGKMAAIMALVTGQQQQAAIEAQQTATVKDWLATWQAASEGAAAIMGGEVGGG